MTLRLALYDLFSKSILRFSSTFQQGPHSHSASNFISHIAPLIKTVYHGISVTINIPVRDAVRRVSLSTLDWTLRLHVNVK